MNCLFLLITNYFSFPTAFFRLDKSVFKLEIDLIKKAL